MRRSAQHQKERRQIWQLCVCGVSRPETKIRHCCKTGELGAKKHVIMRKLTHTTPISGLWATNGSTSDRGGACKTTAKATGPQGDMDMFSISETAPRFVQSQICTHRITELVLVQQLIPSGPNDGIPVGNSRIRRI